MVDNELSVQIESIRCESVIPQVKYTHFYALHTSAGDRVERRFSDFEALIELLNLEFLSEILPAMPDRDATLLAVQDTNDIRLRQRKDDFQILLQSLLNNDKVKQSTLFLDFFREEKFDADKARRKLLDGKPHLAYLTEKIKAKNEG